MHEDVIFTIVKKCMKEIDLIKSSGLPILNLIGSLTNMIRASYMFEVPYECKDKKFIGLVGESFCLFKHYENNTINDLRVDFNFTKTIIFQSNCDIVFNFSLCEPSLSLGRGINLRSFMRFDFNLNKIISAKTDTEKEFKKFFTRICKTFFTPIETPDCFRVNIHSLIAHKCFDLKDYIDTEQLYSTFVLRDMV